MKRHKIQTRPSKSSRAPNTNIPTQPRNVDNAALPAKNEVLRWLTFAVVGAACVGCAFMFTHLWMDQSPFSLQIGPVDYGKAGTGFNDQGQIGGTPWKPERWEPRTAEERLIDQFVKLRQAKDKKAQDLLGPAPIFDKKPVSETAASALQTNYFLRADLRILDIWRGEPDGTGRQRAAPRRFTLITKGNVSAPPLSVRTDKGIDPPSQLMMANPDLIVEIRDGKIHGLRAELHMGP